MSAPQNRPISVPPSPPVRRAPLPKCEPDLRDIQGPPRPFFGDVVTLAIVLRAITFLHLGFQPEKKRWRRSCALPVAGAAHLVRRLSGPSARWPSPWTPPAVGRSCRTAPPVVAVLAARFTSRRSRRGVLAFLDGLRCSPLANGFRPLLPHAVPSVSPYRRVVGGCSCACSPRAPITRYVSEAGLLSDRPAAAASLAAEPRAPSLLVRSVLLQQGPHGYSPSVVCLSKCPPCSVLSYPSPLAQSAVRLQRTPAVRASPRRLSLRALRPPLPPPPSVLHFSAALSLIPTPSLAHCLFARRRLVVLAALLHPRLVRHSIPCASHPSSVPSLCFACCAFALALYPPSIHPPRPHCLVRCLRLRPYRLFLPCGPPLAALSSSVPTAYPLPHHPPCSAPSRPSPLTTPRLRQRRTQGAEHGGWCGRG